MSGPDATLSQLDLAFCVDLTASMTPFVVAARQQLQQILDVVVKQQDLELHLALVGYRDYGSGVELLEVEPFSGNTGPIRRRLDRLAVRSPRENTDAAEAVLAGLLAATELDWRARATRVAVLVGDAPPHGCGTQFGAYPDRFAEDPTGTSLLDVGARLEAASIALYSLAMIPSVTRAYDATTERTFGRLARTTGGEAHNARDGAAAMRVVEQISARVSRSIGLERHLHLALAERRQRQPRRSLRGLVDEAIELLEVELDTSAEEIYAALGRLERRGLGRDAPKRLEQVSARSSAARGDQGGGR